MDRLTKNLVVCCDGTWKAPTDRQVSNVEKIARSITPAGFEGETQIVYYSRGVGTGGSRVEKVLGGAFGFGLDDAIADCYRFLALNFVPGDRIFVFGFSRGAYTARSLTGLIAYLGLLTPQGVAAGQLADMMGIYRDRPRPAHPGDTPPSNPAHDKARADFQQHCHTGDVVNVDFLGVFDTVGALGIPGVAQEKYKFHDVELSLRVRSARQALAIAERRRVFAPCLWGGWHPDIKQVWFDGVHTDIGGGYENCFYSNKTLSWMVDEVESPRDDWPRARLKIDRSLLGIAECTSDKEGNSLRLGYRFSNLVDVVTRAVGLRKAPEADAKDYVEPFAHGWRTFAPTVETQWTATGRAYDVRVERDAIRRARNPNMKTWFDEWRSAGGDPGILEVTLRPTSDE